jgi:hypothetical protein
VADQTDLLLSGNDNDGAAHHTGRGRRGSGSGGGGDLGLGFMPVGLMESIDETQQNQTESQSPMEVQSVPVQATLREVGRLNMAAEVPLAVPSSSASPAAVADAIVSDAVATRCIQSIPDDAVLLHPRSSALSSSPAHFSSSSSSSATSPPPLLSAMKQSIASSIKLSASSMAIAVPVFDAEPTGASSPNAYATLLRSLANATAAMTPQSCQVKEHAQVHTNQAMPLRGASLDGQPRESLQQQQHQQQQLLLAAVRTASPQSRQRAAAAARDILAACEAAEAE